MEIPAQQGHCPAATNAVAPIEAYLVSSQTGIFPYPMRSIDTEIQRTNNPNKNGMLSH